MIRLVGESKCHVNNSFVTLTYSDEHYPPDGGLDYRHVQLFFKRLRLAVGAFRFFVAGEYGEETGRCHWHALLFGVHFSDRVRYSSLYRESDILYTSRVLDSAWKLGECKIGDVNYATARYVAKYCLKDYRGALDSGEFDRVHLATGEIVRVRPPFARMSLRPGIGFPWLEKYWQEVICHDGVVVNGKLKRIPKFYMSKMDTWFKDMDSYEFERMKKALEFPEERTPERLAVRETVAAARVQFDKSKRSYNAL